MGRQGRAGQDMTHVCGGVDVRAKETQVLKVVEVYASKDRVLRPLKNSTENLNKEILSERSASVDEL